MLAADTLKDYVRTIMLPAEEAQARVNEMCAQLEQQGHQDLLHEGIAADKIMLERYLDLRYQGQAYELIIPYEHTLTIAVENFHRTHEQRFGYSDPNERVQVVNVRIKARGSSDKPVLEQRQASVQTIQAAPTAQRPAIFADTSTGSAVTHTTAIYQRETLTPGMQISGPAIITQYDTTTVLPPRWRGQVDEIGNVIIERVEE
jgi:N-methylhydantoinase A